MSALPSPAAQRLSSTDLEEANKLFGPGKHVRPVTPAQLQEFRDYVRSHLGTHVLQDGPDLVAELTQLGVTRDIAVQMRLGHTSSAEFQVLRSTGATFIIHRRGASALDLAHEYAHLLHYNEVGGMNGRWMLYGSREKEQWVYNYLREHHWDKLLPKQQLESIWYIIKEGGFAW